MPAILLNTPVANPAGKFIPPTASLRTLAAETAATPD
jgi:hypothetical protein